jgi:hypothetical protein
MTNEETDAEWARNIFKRHLGMLHSMLNDPTVADAESVEEMMDTTCKWAQLVDALRPACNCSCNNNN